MEIGKTFCGRTDGRTDRRTDGRTHLSSNLLGHRRGDDLKMVTVVVNERRCAVLLVQWLSAAACECDESLR